MSPIAMAMNLVLAILLLSALGFGLRLERRLKALRDGQASFTGAVADLDRAAQRAERGLAELRAATDEAIDLLAGRIEKARELANRLDTLAADASRPIARTPVEPPRPAPGRTEATTEDLVLRLTEKAVARSRVSIDDDLFDSAPRAAVGGRR